LSADSDDCGSRAAATTSALVPATNSYVRTVRRSFGVPFFCTKPLLDGLVSVVVSLSNSATAQPVDALALVRDFF